MIILCANTLIPPRRKQTWSSEDGAELSWAINYLANYHLLSILSPALRAQPPDRDVRVIMAACPSYIGAKFKSSDEAIRKERLSNTGLYGASKLALMVFAASFQKHLDVYVRPDKQPNNARVLLVDPGWTRTPGMRRWLSFGSLWGLLIYMICWPMWWVLLKSPEQGSQSFLYASMDEKLREPAGIRLIKECREVDFARTDIDDESVGKELWEASAGRIEALEKEGALKRARAKKADTATGNGKIQKEEKGGDAGVKRRAGR